MKSCFIFSLTTLLLIGCEVGLTDSGKEDTIRGFNPATWKSLEEPSVGFKTRFPGQWKHRTEYLDTPQGKATVHIYEYWHVAFQYGITVAKFPPGVADMSDPDRVLDYSVQSLATEHDGLVSYQESKNFGGYPARRAMISLPGSYLKDARINTTIILRNELVYRVTTSGIGNHEFVEYFMDSFELTPVMIKSSS